MTVKVNIGDKFTFLTVLSDVKDSKKRIECICDCGKITQVLIYDLIKEHTKSCGCLKNITIKNTHKTNLKHDIKIGDVFKRLTVIELLFNPSNKKVKCRCECGNETILSVSNLLKTNSCGCFHKEIMASKNPWQTELNSYKHHNADKRNLIWDLSLENFIKLINQNCFYCNLEPNITTHVSKLKRNSIDRVDSTIGYILSNCVPCCKVCNNMKKNLPQSQFIELISKIYLNIKSGRLI